MDRYVKIYDWMLELGLKGTEINALAVVYSFGRDGEWFQGSASYLGKWMGVKKRETVLKALSKLVEKNLIEKRDRWQKGEKLCDYRPVRKTDGGCPENGQGAYPKNGRGPYPKNGHHNNRPDIYRPDSDSDKKEIYKESFVHLSVDEFKKLHNP